MQTRKKSRQPGRQPWSEEKQRAFNKMALLQRAVDKARQEEADNQEREMAQLLKGSKTIWERQN